MYYGNFSVLNNLNVAYATCDNLGCHCVVEANGVPNVQLTVQGNRIKLWPRQGFHEGNLVKSLHGIDVF